MRLFIAIRPPENVQQAAFAATEVRIGGHADIRTVPAGSIHLTLAFLGEVDEGTAARITDELAPVVGQHAGFELQTTGWGRFPSRGRPRVYWLGISESQELGQLARAVRRSVDWVRPELEERSFRPHLTVARVGRRQSSPIPRLPPAFSPIPGWSVTDVELMRSQLGSGPAKYTRLAGWKLTGRESLANSGRSD